MANDVVAAPAGGLMNLGGGLTCTVDGLMSVVRTLAGASTLPAHFRREADLMAAALSAAQLGLPLMTVVNGCHLINGKVTLSADLMVGVVRGSGMVESWSEAATTRPVGYRVRATRRGGGEADVTFTVEHAKQAGLRGGNWQSYPEDMCRARAVARVCRRLFPDVLAGMYATEEMDGTRHPDAVGAPVTATLEPAGPDPEEETAIADLYREAIDGPDDSVRREANARVRATYRDAGYPVPAVLADLAREAKVACAVPSAEPDAPAEEPSAPVADLLARIAAVEDREALDAAVLAAEQALSAGTFAAGSTEEGQVSGALADAETRIGFLEAAEADVVDAEFADSDADPEEELAFEDDDPYTADTGDPFSEGA